MNEITIQADVTLTDDETEELLRCALSYTGYLQVYSASRQETAVRLVQKGLLYPKDGKRAYKSITANQTPELRRGAKLLLTKQGEQVILSLSPDDFSGGPAWPSARDVRQAHERVRKFRKLAAVYRQPFVTSAV